MNRFFSLVVILVASWHAMMSQQSAKSEPKTIYIRAGRLFDGTGDNIRENMVMVVLGMCSWSFGQSGSGQSKDKPATQNAPAGQTTPATGQAA